MRLTDHQVEAIRRLAIQLAGDQVRVRVFGSRLDDAARGGDLDIMLELSEPVDSPALLAARISRDAWAQGGCTSQRAEPDAATYP